MKAGKWENLINLVYPRNCYACGKELPETLRFLCWDCLANTQKVEPPFCAICGDPVAGDISHDYICHWCAQKKPKFEMARSTFRYDGIIAQLLQDLKYHNHTWLADDFAELIMHTAYAEFPMRNIDFICAVPLHPSKFRSRGFNQSALIAKKLSKKTEIPFLRFAIQRILPTSTQTNLTAIQREANIRRAFEPGLFYSLAGKKVLLIDDVMTTGATTNACARALKKGGAACVYVITVARG